MKKFFEKIDIKAAFKKKGFKYGGFSMLIIAVVLALVIGVNLIVSALPATLTKFDVSTQQLYTLSGDTEELVSGLEQDITLYLVTQTGNEDVAILETLERYAALSDKIKVSTKDAAIYPNFVSQYTDTTLSDNSVIAVSGGRSRAIDYNDIYVGDYSQYYTNGSVTYSYNAEQEITSAIDYLTRTALPKMYLLTGHGEAELSAAFAGYIEKDNIETAELALLTEGSIPEDASLVMINAPTGDISEDELAILNAYLEGGGKLFLVTNYDVIGMKNLCSLMAGYGAAPVEGMVLDTDPGHYANYYNLIVPDKSGHAITSPISNDGLYNVAMSAHGITISDTLRSSLSVTGLLTTSSASYSKRDVQSDSAEKESGDAEGPFNVAIAAEEDYNGVDTRIVWLGSGTFLDENLDAQISGGNSDLVLNSLNWLAGEAGSDISIHAKQLQSEALTFGSSSTVIMWAALLIIVLPVIIIVAGLVFWLRRRKL